MKEFEWKSKVGGWRIVKVIENNGSDVTSPTDGSMCCVSIQLLNSKPENCKIEMTIAECEQGTLELGEGSTAMDTALEYSIQTMKMGETCHTTITTTTKEGSFRVILHSFTVGLQIWEMTGAQKLAKAEHLKADGVKLFNAQKIESAFGKFSKAVKILVTADDGSDQDTVERCQTLRRTCYLNIAACQLQRGKYNHVVTNCDKVLLTDPGNMKAMYRRGTALINLQEYDRAKEDLMEVLRVERGNVPAQLQMITLKEKIEMQNEYYKKAMMKLFQS